MADIRGPQKRVCYVVSNELVKVSSLLPSNKNRSFLVHSLVKSFGILGHIDENARLQVLRPLRAEQRDLLSYHTRDYIDFVLDSEKTSPLSEGSSLQHVEYGIEEDCPPFSGLPEYVRLVAGASLTAADALRQDRADIAICWDGGRHHAQKSHASGFCYVADCILSILALKRASVPSPVSPPAPTPARKSRIMYLDLDLHFSDAVSHAFSSTSRGTPQVLTLSLHHAAPGFFPASPLSALPNPSDTAFDPFTLSLPLAAGAADATFARAWRSVERVRDAFRPDVVVLQCGVDGLAGDPCAVWNWSLGAGAGSLGWCVGRVCRGWACKVLLLGGGGYHSPNAARAWTYLTAVALGRGLALDADIPDHTAFPLYAPSFTLDVPAGNTPDKNTDRYLGEVEACFEHVAEAIKDRMSPGVVEQ
ncbi:histone deacetylase 8 [Amylocystis lapponica]|nr:histone deacetylase 8 [Amylocystis lapponica]